MGQAETLLAVLALGLATAAAPAMAAEKPSGLFADPALAHAACDGKPRAIAAAVKAGADPNAAGDGVDQDGVPKGVTPLIWAIVCHNPAGVEAMLAAGADPNHPAPDHRTPVTVAAENPNNAILPILLKHGGDPNSHTDRKTALGLALVRGAEEEIRGEAPAKAWANWQALLDAGADINRPDGLRETPMFYATAEDRYDKVVELLERGDRGDPVVLGRSLTAYLDIVDRMPARSVAAQQPWIDKVKAYLDQRGVRLPVPPLAGLSKDANGRYIQP